MGKQVKKPKIRKQGDTIILTIPVDYSTTGEHTTYSGYGYHGKDRRADRRERKLEEKRAQKGGWE